MLSAPNYGIFIRFAVIVFVVAGIILLFGPAEYFPSFYNPLFMGVWSLINALLIIAPVIIFKSNNQEKMQSAIGLQMGFTLALILNGFGAVGFYQLFRFGIPYDKIVHFTASLILTASFANFVWIWFGVHSRKLAIFVLFFAILAGFGWEGLEFSFDYLFGTKTLGLNGGHIFWDSSWDIIMDFFGIVIGFLIFEYKIKGIGKFKIVDYR